MKFAPFEYRRPSSLGEVDACLEGEDTRLLAGGQSLLPLMAFRLARPRVLVDLAAVGELRGIRIEQPGSAIAAGGARAASLQPGTSGSPGMPAPSYLVVGAMTTHAELRASALAAANLPLLRHVAAEIGHPAIRHLGTIGGSLAHADPAAEWPATCIALGAEVELHAAGGSRRLPVERLLLGPYQTVLAEGEVLCAVRFPLATGMSGALAEVARRPGDFALAGAVCTAWRSQQGALRNSDAPVAGEARSGGSLASGSVTLFGVCGRPVRVELPPDLLADPRTSELSALLDLHLDGALADHQADATFRRHLAAVVAGRAIRAAAAAPGRAPGDGRAPGGGGTPVGRRP
ncbi:MAG TPA: FAD binding domain-containing protein [Acidimicrobiales bacterium]|nr:FAD binding domain-containing protein [Acidimicrobiales bacterium]